MTEETGRLRKRHRIKTWRKRKRRSAPLPSHISKEQSKRGLYTQFPKIKLRSMAFYQTTKDHGEAVLM
jgi:hypothetical protein